MFCCNYVVLSAYFVIVFSSVLHGLGNEEKNEIYTKQGLARTNNTDYKIIDFGQALWWVVWLLLY